MESQSLHSIGLRFKFDQHRLLLTHGGSSSRVRSGAHESEPFDLPLRELTLSNRKNGKDRTEQSRAEAGMRAESVGWYLVSDNAVSVIHPSDQ
jgi:hypothetical protein